MKPNWITSFIDGLSSVISIPGLVKGVIASGVSDGLQVGINRITPSLVKLALVSGFLVVGLFMLALGLGNALETVFRTPGLGFAIAGGAFIALGGLYYAYKR